MPKHRLLHAGTALLGAGLSLASSASILRSLAEPIAAFERSLVSFGSPYDRYRYGGDADAISAAAKRGEQLFNQSADAPQYCADRKIGIQAPSF